MLAILALSIHIITAFAGKEEDTARLGTYYTNIAIYRSGSGNNVVSVGLGDPVQDFNLTLSTNVEFILVAADDCDDCLNDAETYKADDSRTITASQRALAATAIFPTSQGSIDVIQLNGNLVTERVTDPREDSFDRVIGVLNEVEEVTELGQRTRPANLPEGVSGFFGLGVNQVNKQWSIMPSLYQTNGRGEPAGVAGYVVGVDMAQYSRDLGVRAGDLYFGGVPPSSYTGNFNWRDANKTVAGSWGTDIDRLRVSGNVIDGGQYYASLDPGFDSIYVPARVAEELFSVVPNAVQDRSEPTRWNIPCDTQIAMTVTIANREYNVEASQLVQQKGPTPSLCWSSIVAWQNGSLPDTNGEIRLGTPFLSGVYVAFYYSDKEQFVGLAGKPDSVNDFNALAKERSGPNGKLAGILIGSLLAALIILLIGCYARNRNSFQSVWYRGIRRHHRAQTNAIIRAATIPPPMVGAMGAPMVVPPMMNPQIGMGMAMGPGMGRMGVPAYMPVPMGPGPGSGGYGPQMMAHGPGHGYGHGPGYGQGQGGWPQAPPMYQAPMQPHPPQSQPQQQQYPQQQAPQMIQTHGQGQTHQNYPHPIQQPMSVEHTPRGVYSARHQSLPLPKHGRHPSQSHRHPSQSKPSRYSHPAQHPNAEGTYGPRHGDYQNGDLGEGLLGANMGVGDRYHTTLAPAQKLHFGGVHARRDRHQYGGGPGPISEGSMVQRDRIKVADEAARIDALSLPQPPPQLEALRKAREAELHIRRQEDQDYKQQLQPNPADDPNRKSWKSLLSRDKAPRYPIQSYQSETGRNIEEERQRRKAKKWQPKPSSTWIKSHYGERGWSGWKKAEREKERRAGVLGEAESGGRGDGQWYS